jgi:prepilin-type N-terminal cleavage/methylation domain-containing protein
MTRLIKSHGFSLVELMVALGILAVGTAAVGSMIYTSLQTDRFTMGSRRAQEVSSKIIEKIRAGNPGLGTGSSCDLLKLPSSGDAAYSGGDCVNPSQRVGTYYASWTSQDQTDGVKRLDVTVGWAGPDCSITAIQNCRYKIRTTTYYR